jgi:hypothetical protein
MKRERERENEKFRGKTMLKLPYSNSSEIQDMRIY